MRTHSLWSGPGGRMLYRSEANACAAFIIADNNHGSFLSDIECVPMDDITGLAYSGEIIKTHIHAERRWHVGFGRKSVMV